MQYAYKYTCVQSRRKVRWSKLRLAKNLSQQNECLKENVSEIDWLISGVSHPKTTIWLWDYVVGHNSMVHTQANACRFMLIWRMPRPHISTQQTQQCQGSVATGVCRMCTHVQRSIKHCSISNFSIKYFAVVRAAETYKILQQRIAS